MIPIADRVLKQCELYLERGDFENASKCAMGVSILTDQPAWKKSYDFLMSNGDCKKEITETFVEIPDDFKEKLSKLHDSDGKNYINQSVRGGTQVNLTHTEYCDWVEKIVNEEVIGLWTTRLLKGGYHIPHLHPRGYNSHVIYVSVPDSESGTLYFGRPRYANIEPKLEIKAKKGKMVSFPCWLWHGVSTYLHEEPRIALAFDTVPYA